MEYLLKALVEGDVIVEYKIDEERHLSHLFFAHEKNVSLFKDNYDIIRMDCAYKTNRFNMPLLNIIGVTGMNTKIHIAQASIQNEKFEDF